MSFITWKTGKLIKASANNTQVTHDSNPKNARSESAVAADPFNSRHVVCASKRFRAETPPDLTHPEPESYEFVIVPLWSDDDGFTWHEVELTRHPDWPNSTDPALAWDTLGNLYLMVLPLGPAPNLEFKGVAIYKSTDGGQSWSAPNLIHPGAGDDKGWMTADGSGRVYAAWDADVGNATNLDFARTVGSQWKGLGSPAGPAGTAVPGVGDSFSPTLSVTSDGTLWIFWLAGNQIKYVTSSDRGTSFSAPATAAVGLTSLGAFGGSGGFPQLPGEKFRVPTVPTSVARGDSVYVAWADAREQVAGQRVARIYYRQFSKQYGWLGDPSGEPLLKGSAVSGANAHAFHPQLAVASDGVIGCAFYELGPKGTGGKLLIDVILATPRLGKPWFIDSPRFTPGLLSVRTVVTDAPWDPLIDAPWSHGDQTVTFIGDYFGCCGADEGFDMVWTDTRTGIQELFFNRVEEERFVLQIPDKVVNILFGVVQDGGGVVWVPGKGPVPVPPRGPVREAVIGAAIGELAKRLAKGDERAAIEDAAKQLVGKAQQGR
jgi:hypothetical protein